MLNENVDAIIITDFQNPNYGGRTAGAYRIATELRKNGYTCQVIDCFTDLTEEQKLQIFDKVIGSNTKMFGLSTTFFTKENGDFTENYPYSIEKMRFYFDYVKRINPNIKVVVGGYKAHFNNCPGADILITGLADSAIIECMRFLENKNPFFSYDRNKHGQIVIDGNQHNSKFDFNNSSIHYEQHDNLLHNEVLPIEIARGCIFKCKFCSYALNGKSKNDYIKESSVIRNELLRNYHEFGITKYIYVDDTHNDNILKLEAMADIAQSLPFELKYAAYLRIDLIHAHQQQYQLLKDSGLQGAFFGIETLNHESGKIIGKGLHPDKTVEELYRFQDMMPHVGTMGGFICGLPSETKESVKSWVDVIIQPSFPIDTVMLQPLKLSKNADKFYKSEFEENKGNWYTWKDGSSTEWDNGNFNERWAKEFCTRVRTEIKPRQRIGGWSSVLTSGRGDIELTKQPWSLHAATLASIKNQFRIEYIKKLLN